MEHGWAGSAAAEGRRRPYARIGLKFLELFGYFLFQDKK